MADDSYKTIKQVAEGYYTEKRSRFISYCYPRAYGRRGEGATGEIP